MKSHESSGWSGWWWLEHGYYFPYISYIGNVIIPADFHIFQRGWNHQPAYNQIVSLFQDHLWPSKSKKNRSGSDLELYDIELQLDQRHLSGTEQNASSCPGLSGFRLQNPCRLCIFHRKTMVFAIALSFVTLSHCHIVMLFWYHRTYRIIFIWKLYEMFYIYIYNFYDENPCFNCMFCSCVLWHLRHGAGETSWEEDHPFRHLFRRGLDISGD